MNEETRRESQIITYTFTFFTITFTQIFHTLKKITYNFNMLLHIIVLMFHHNNNNNNNNKT